MYLSRSTRTPVNGAHPRLTIADIASKYDGRGDESARSAAVSKARPGRLEGTGWPIASSSVDRMCTARRPTDDERHRPAAKAEPANNADTLENKVLCVLCRLCELCVPDGISATISGTRSVASYANRPCVCSPWSPSASP